MDKKKIDKETAIKSILSSRKKGIDKATILQKLTRTYKNSLKSFYNYYDEAEIQYQQFLSIVNPLIISKEAEALATVAASGILSKIERQKILTQIALGEIPLVKYIVCDKMIEQVEIVPNWSDRKNAIDILNKMDGSYISEDKPADEIKPITFRIIQSNSND